ncbi:MAG: hypothetical protein LBQ88_08585 [Treponema sp.]|nr:hypothetical protein [Treponema sp.]
MRNGTGDIFMFAAPLEGWRRAEVREQRTKKDWTEIELSVINNQGVTGPGRDGGRDAGEERSTERERE